MGSVYKAVTQAIKKNYGAEHYEVLMRVLHLGNEPKSDNGTTEKLAKTSSFILV